MQLCLGPLDVAEMAKFYLAFFVNGCTFKLIFLCPLYFTSVCFTLSRIQIYLRLAGGHLPTRTVRNSVTC